jgi:hypothetical protein
MPVHDGVSDKVSLVAAVYPLGQYPAYTVAGTANGMRLWLRLRSCKATFIVDSFID